MSFLDLFPRRCFRCGVPSPQGVLCRPCAARLQPRPADDAGLGPCPVCGQVRLAERGPCMDCAAQPWAFTLVDGVSGYQEPGGELLRAYKFGGLTPLAAQWVGAACRLTPRGPLVPVPPLGRHRRRRGWDPVETLVRTLGRSHRLPVWRVLVRKPSASQKSLGKEGRMANAAQAYALARRLPEGLGGTPLVWLVDDVVTTGATVEACSRLLLGAGVGEVRVFCLGLH